MGQVDILRMLQCVVAVCRSVLLQFTARANKSAVLRCCRGMGQVHILIVLQCVVAVYCRVLVQCIAVRCCSVLPFRGAAVG